MVYVGILPYSYDDEGRLVFLLGKEAQVKDWPDSLKWSGFGGNLEPTDQSIYHGVAREAYEESMSFLGTQDEILDQILLNKVYITEFNLGIEPSVQRLSINAIPPYLSTVNDRVISSLPPLVSSSYQSKSGPRSNLSNSYQDIPIAYHSLLQIDYDPDISERYRRVYDYVRSSTYDDYYPEAVTFLGKRDGFYEKIDIEWFDANYVYNQSAMDENDRHMDGEEFVFRPAFMDNIIDLWSLDGPWTIEH